MMRRGPMAEGFGPLVAGVVRVPAGQWQHTYNQLHGRGRSAVSVQQNYSSCCSSSPE
jgi:hypothetical protein